MNSIYPTPDNASGGSRDPSADRGADRSRTGEKVAPPGIGQMTMVLHGPEIFDSGIAAWLVEVLAPGRILVAGVMARAAAEESGLPCEYPSVPPSVVIRSLDEPCYLADQGKTPESGRIFGEIIASRLGNSGLLHVECRSREIICWNRDADDIASEISQKTGYRIIERSARIQQFREGCRTIRGCIPGEPVFVNGTIIGRATAPEVCLRLDGSKLVPVSGLQVKDHGLEKLQKAGRFDISRAWCKSGTIRSTTPSTSAMRSSAGLVLFVDHCGHQIYQMIMEENICGMVSVGDDTTAVCGHIGAHMGIPVLGIVDGDCDGIIPPRYAPGSLMAVAQGISDDELGREVSRIIPEGTVSWSECVTRIVAFIGDRAKISSPD